MITVATTTVEIRRPSSAEPVDLYADGYDTATATLAPPTLRKARGVRAVITDNAGRSTNAGNGDEESVEFTLVCDPTDLTYRDTVIDEVTGATYQVTWSMTTPGIAGMSHTRAGLITVKGLAS